MFDILIATDAAAQAHQLRELLIERGLHCSPNNVLSLNSAANGQRSRRGHGIAFVVVPDHRGGHVRAIEALKGTERLVVAVGTAQDADVILAAIHAGADDFLDSGRELGPQIDSLLKRRLASIEHQANDGPLIAVAAACGGVGASSVAVNLSVALAQRAGPCSMCDLVLRGGDVAALMNLRPRYHLLDLIRNIANVDASMVEQALVKTPYNVGVLASPPPFADLSSVSARALRHVLGIIRQASAYTIADIDVFSPLCRDEALRSSGLLIVVVRLEFASLVRGKAVLRFLSDRKYPLDSTFVVANRSGQAKEVTVAQAEKAMGHKVSALLPDDPRTANGSCNLGSPYSIEAPKSKLGLAMAGLADEVFRRLKPQAPEKLETACSTN